MNNEQKKRFIELIRDWVNQTSIGGYESLTDFLVENNVVVLPCKVGDTVYEIIEDTVPTHHCYISEYEVQDVSSKAVMYADDWHSFDCPNLYFTKEEAEKALAEMIK